MQENLSLDRVMLAYALRDKKFTMELSNGITFEYFHPELQWLYKAITDHFNNPKFKEIPTIKIIKEYLTTNYSTSSFISKGVKLFNELLEIELDPSEFTWYLEKLRIRYNDQVQRICASNIIKLIKTDNTNEPERVQKINEIIRKSVITIDSIHRREAYKEGSLSDSAKDRAVRYKQIESNPDLAKGIYTGFSDFDRITNGLHGGELIIISGPTSHGKSIVMQNMAVNAYLGGNDPVGSIPDNLEDFTGGNNILYFSLEMPQENQERRIDACMAGIPYNDIRDGKLNTENKNKYSKVLRFQTKFPKTFHIVDMARGTTVREIELKYIEMKESYGIKFDLVVVDYLGIMRPTTQQPSDWLNLGFTSEELHEFARVYHIPVITGTQVNRPKDPNKPQHSTDRVARSDMVPSNANIIIQIGSRGDDEHTRLDMPMYITKNRDGEKTSFTLIKNFACMQVKDMMDESFNNEDEDDIV
jgi:replicative DNA helicase